MLTPSANDFHYSYAELCSCWSADPNTRPSALSLVNYFQVQKEGKELPSSLVSVVIIILNASQLQSSGILCRLNKVTAMKPNKQLLKLFVANSPILSLFCKSHILLDISKLNFNSKTCASARMSEHAHKHKRPNLRLQINMRGSWKCMNPLSSRRV